MRKTALATLFALAAVPIAATCAEPAGKRERPSLPVGSAPEDVQGIPRMIIIGRDGKVAADHTGYGEGMIPQLVDELNALLAQKI